MTIKEKQVINFALNLNESYEAFLKYSNKYHNKEFERVAHDYLNDWSIAYTIIKILGLQEEYAKIKIKRNNMNRIKVKDLTPCEYKIEVNYA